MNGRAALIDRPAHTRYRGWIPLDLLLSTATNGKAVRLALDGRDFLRAYRSIHMAVRRRGLRAVVVLDADEAHVLAWVLDHERP